MILDRFAFSSFSFLSRTYHYKVYIHASGELLCEKGEKAQRIQGHLFNYFASRQTHTPREFASSKILIWRLWRAISSSHVITSSHILLFSLKLPKILRGTRNGIEDFLLFLIIFSHNFIILYRFLCHIRHIRQSTPLCFYPRFPYWILHQLLEGALSVTEFL